MKRAQVLGPEVAVDAYADHTRWGCIERYVVHRATGIPEEEEEPRTLRAVRLGPDDDWSSLESVELRVGDQMISEVTDEALRTLKLMPGDNLPFPAVALEALPYHDVIVILHLRCTWHTCDALHRVLAHLSPFLPHSLASIVLQYTRRLAVSALYEPSQPLLTSALPVSFYLQPLECFAQAPKKQARFLRLTSGLRLRNIILRGALFRWCAQKLNSDGWDTWALLEVIDPFFQIIGFAESSLVYEFGMCLVRGASSLTAQWHELRPPPEEEMRDMKLTSDCTSAYDPTTLD